MTLWEWPPDALPLVIAHRGASSVAPENTLAAFRAAQAAGADGIEVDVHLCATGEPVVIHDERVDRTTDGSGAVAALSLAELRRLDAGSWRDERCAGERIPTLDEVLEMASDRLLVNVEIKGAVLHRDGLEASVARSVRMRSMCGRVLISSFDPAVLLCMSRLAPELPLALLYTRMPAAGLAGRLAPRLLGLHALHPRHDVVDAAAVAAAHRRGCLVNVWTVDEAAEMRRLIRLGVDGIITDDPALLRQVSG